MGKTPAYSGTLLPHPAHWIHFGFLWVVMVTPETRSHDEASALDDSREQHGRKQTGQIRRTSAGFKCHASRDRRQRAAVASVIFTHGFLRTG